MSDRVGDRLLIGILVLTAHLCRLRHGQRPVCLDTRTAIRSLGDPDLLTAHGATSTIVFVAFAVAGTAIVGQVAHAPDTTATTTVTERVRRGSLSGSQEHAHAHTPNNGGHGGGQDRRLPTAYGQDSHGRGHGGSQDRGATQTAARAHAHG